MNRGNRNKEIEIKVRVQKPDRLVSFLMRNARKKGTLHQIDEYFVPAHRNFLDSEPVREWLRLRNEDGTCTINYKYFYYGRDGRSTQADEFETQVEDAGQIQKIFKALGLKRIVKVDKVRDSWAYGNYEIGIDRVAGLGSFVEIEFNGRGGGSKRITDEMVGFLKKVGVGRIERNYQGYPFLILFPERVVFHEG
ncbi:MAG: class IV adenylate cyclase [Candidatus Micrarchaeota archaeon]|nr:class IV adenylate cyclase [Candidatus Micrarchaeota archaeon]